MLEWFRDALIQLAWEYKVYIALGVFGVAALGTLLGSLKGLAASLFAAAARAGESGVKSVLTRERLRAVAPYAIGGVLLGGGYLLGSGKLPVALQPPPKIEPVPLPKIVYPDREVVKEVVREVPAKSLADQIAEIPGKLFGSDSSPDSEPRSTVVYDDDPAPSVRCPHCGKYFFNNSNGMVRCPRCGKTTSAKAAQKEFGQAPPLWVEPRPSSDLLIELDCPKCDDKTLARRYGERLRCSFCKTYYTDIQLKEARANKELLARRKKEHQEEMKRWEEKAKERERLAKVVNFSCPECEWGHRTERRHAGETHKCLVCKHEYSMVEVVPSWELPEEERQRRVKEKEERQRKKEEARRELERWTEFPCPRCFIKQNGQNKDKGKETTCFGCWMRFTRGQAAWPRTVAFQCLHCSRHVRNGLTEAGSKELYCPECRRWSSADKVKVVEEATLGASGKDQASPDSQGKAVAASTGKGRS